MLASLQPKLFPGISHILIALWLRGGTDILTTKMFTLCEFHAYKKYFIFNWTKYKCVKLITVKYFRFPFAIRALRLI